MKFLHTADWHVGRTIRGQSRAVEHEAVLAEIGVDRTRPRSRRGARRAATCSTRRHRRPSRSASSTGRCSTSRLDRQRESSSSPATTTATGDGRPCSRCSSSAQSITRPVFADPDTSVVEVPSRDGREVMLVAALPFLSQRWVVESRAADGRRGVRVGAALRGALPKAVRLVVRPLPARHRQRRCRSRVRARVGSLGLRARGASERGLRRACHGVSRGRALRGARSSPPAQQIPGPCPIRYCGSPLQLDFGEAGQGKVALVVEASAGLAGSGHRGAADGGPPACRSSRARSPSYAERAVDPDAYVRVHVTREACASGWPTRCASCSRTRSTWCSTAQRTGASSAELETRVGRSPRELFDAYLEERRRRRRRAHRAVRRGVRGGLRVRPVRLEFEGFTAFRGRRRSTSTAPTCSRSPDRRAAARPPCSTPSCSRSTARSRGSIGARSRRSSPRAWPRRGCGSTSRSATTSTRRRVSCRRTKTGANTAEARLESSPAKCSPATLTRSPRRSSELLGLSLRALHQVRGAAAGRVRSLPARQAEGPAGPAGLSARSRRLRPHGRARRTSSIGREGSRRRSWKVVSGICRRRRRRSTLPRRTCNVSTALVTELDAAAPELEALGTDAAEARTAADRLAAEAAQLAAIAVPDGLDELHDRLTAVAARVMEADRVVHDAEAAHDAAETALAALPDPSGADPAPCEARPLRRAAGATSEERNGGRRAQDRRSRDSARS